jgi:hypothetical protein
VVVGAAVVVETVVVGEAVAGAVTGGWVVAASKVENASEVVVAPAVAGAWAMAGSAVVVGLLMTRGPVAEVGAKRMGAAVGSRGPVVGVDTVLAAGSAGMAGSARAGIRRSGAD